MDYMHLDVCAYVCLWMCVCVLFSVSYDGGGMWLRMMIFIDDGGDDDNMIAENEGGFGGTATCKATGKRGWGM